MQNDMFMRRSNKTYNDRSASPQMLYTGEGTQNNGQVSIRASALYYKQFANKQKGLDGNSRQD